MRHEMRHKKKKEVTNLRFYTEMSPNASLLLEFRRK